MRHERNAFTLLFAWILLQDMTNEQLKKAHTARPFQPFVIRTADGREFSVNHPEVLAFAPPARTCAVATPDGTIEVIDLLLVSSLQMRRSANGRRRSDR